MEFCRLCLDGCPRHAIDMTDAGIRFDSSRCTGCALCLSDCPTEVFTHDGFTPVDFITLAKGKKELSLCCQSGDPDQIEQGSLSIPCHGLLDDRLLVGLYTMGVKRLNLYGLDRCSDCLSKAGARRLAQTLEKAPATLKAHFPSLHGVAETGDIFTVTSDENGTVPKAAETPMDRRRFLDGVVNAVAYTALSSLPVKLLPDQSANNGLVAPEQSECMIKHVPQSHRLARLSLQSGNISTGDTGDASAWFYEVRDHGACDACGVCSLSCPTGALRIEDMEQALRLNHQPSTCIGCGLCLSLCPQQSLQLFVVHDDAIISDDGVHTLFECEKIRCSSCGASATYPDSRTSLCRPCENEKAIRSQWTGEAG
ncbi:MAG: 4Fe-4S binding protein [Mariprofundaceae bacterium]|nr:4Fe-4S binding protein [Mariprofundaceae bacterium]